MLICEDMLISNEVYMFYTTHLPTLLVREWGEFE